MHQFRTHTCNELRKEHLKSQVRLSGWVHSKRDHGSLIFIDLRDHFGITQCVIDKNSKFFAEIEHVRVESILTITGLVRARSVDTINEDLLSGEIEVVVEDLIVENSAKVLPFLVAEDDNAPESIRLKYRFLDLRRARNHANIILRSQIISFIRQQMEEHGFLEMQTPILTASSPEGARDFLVPSRKHIGKFYALPQAPQQFKQLFMVSGFDKYFQIAPCFRDEDARADRTPGEFYQLDFEMAFATQEDVFKILDDVMYKTFNKFAGAKKVTKPPFPRIPYLESMDKYGTDKPDLRNPLIITKTTEAFKNSEFSLFANLIAKGASVLAIAVPNSAEQPRSFFDKLNAWARSEGQGGLGYIVFDSQGGAKGPIASKLTAEELALIQKNANTQKGDSVFFVCGKGLAAQKFAGLARTKIAEELNLITENTFEFCFITDFPMYEINEETGKIDFSHNPFSMPQGGMEALNKKNPLDVLAYQYDIVCNGVELSSGAVRNHRPDIMVRAFEIAGYTKEFIESKFAGIFNAFQYGAPPHAGSAPGIDRIVMLLADSQNIREIIAFPLTQTGEDLLMGAPNTVSSEQLRELHISMKLPNKGAK